MRFAWLTPKILEIRFDKSFDLCHNTYLFSHHYEDPEWHGKIFTRLELDEYYENKFGDADWWKKRWAGSNLPDHIFTPFLEGRFISLSHFEEIVLDEIRNVQNPFYVIMTSEEALYARDHEVAHALWHTNAEYRSRAEVIVDEYSLLVTDAAKTLREFGYADKVLQDELHVYCGIYYDSYFARIGIAVPEDMRTRLQALFNEFKP